MKMQKFLFNRLLFIMEILLYPVKIRRVDPLICLINKKGYNIEKCVTKFSSIRVQQLCI